MNEDSKQQREQEQYTQQDGSQKTEQKKNTGYGDLLKVPTHLYKIQMHRHCCSARRDSADSGTVSAVFPGFPQATCQQA